MKLKTEPVCRALGLLLKTVAVATCSAFLLVCLGCSVGRNFETGNVSKLELGCTRMAECELMFGRPVVVARTRNENGTFKLATYQYAAGAIAQVKMARVLKLEFKEDVLNGFALLDTFNPQQVKTNAVSEIKVAVSAKADVLRLLGQPNCKGLCPSPNLFSQPCRPDVSEVWTWIDIARSVRPKVNAGIAVSFDSNGFVSKWEDAGTQ